MRTFLLFPFLILAQILPAQEFTEFLQFTPLKHVQEGSVSFADVNGDNHPDLLITGKSNDPKVNDPTARQYISKLYINDGDGFFNEKPDTILRGASYSDAAFGDVNGDSYLDVIISGTDEDFNESTYMYLNDGEGNFTEVSSDSVPFLGLAFSSVALADVNGDNRQDVLIGGQGLSGRTIELYLQDKDSVGKFVKVDNIPFPGIGIGSIDFVDVNGNGHMDVLITGYTGNFGDGIADLFINDGLGNFTKKTGTPFHPVKASASAFTDVNGDGTQDVLITGYDDNLIPSAKLYTNDGTGNFTEVMGTPFIGVRSGALDFADVNGDGSMDVLIAGRNSDSTADRTLNLYLNDGVGNFTQVTPVPFNGSRIGVFEADLAIEDVNGDTYPDVVFTGNWGGNFGRSRLYMNDGNGNFTERKANPLPDISYGTINVADLDGDSDLDILVNGSSANSSVGVITSLYLNDGNAFYTEKTNTPFDSVQGGYTHIADFDEDGHPDVLINGNNSNSEPLNSLYTNDGAGNFTKIPNLPFTNVFSGSSAIGDVNGDNHLDILITGGTPGISIFTPSPIAQLFTGDGTGNFTEVTGTPFVEVYKSSVAFADVNGDTYEDVIITGEDTFEILHAALYLNDGMGNFTEKTDVPFAPTHEGAIAVEDINDDGYQDVLITGYDTIGGRVSKLYTNDGVGNFTEMMNTPFEGLSWSAVEFSDVNNDSFPDLFIMGRQEGSVSLDRIAKLFINDGSGNFTELLDTPFEGVEHGDVAIADVNGDSLQDIVLTGLTGSYRRITQIFLQKNDAVSTSNGEMLPFFEKVLDFTLYPNPINQDHLFIDYRSSANEHITLRVLSMTGQLLQQKKVFTATGQETLRVDISDLPRGNYFLQIDNGKQVGTGKFIVL